MYANCVQGLALVQIMFEMYTTNSYFENKVGIKTTTANLQLLLIWKSFRTFKHFYSAKSVSMKLETFFISSTRLIFTKLLAVSESSIKIKVRFHLTLFEILFSSAVIYKNFYMETRLCNIFKTVNAMT